MSSLDHMGVNVVEAAEEVETANENEDTQSSGNVSDDVSNSDDPVRMYLREMGSVELLSRKRDSDCQADRSRTRDDDGGICECPLAINAVLEWADKVQDNALPLRDIIDLDLTYIKLNGVPVEDNSALPVGRPDGIAGVVANDDDANKMMMMQIQMMRLRQTQMMMQRVMSPVMMIRTMMNLSLPRWKRVYLMM